MVLPSISVKETISFKLYLPTSKSGGISIGKKVSLLFPASIGFGSVTSFDSKTGINGSILGVFSPSILILTSLIIEPRFSTLIELQKLQKYCLLLLLKYLLDGWFLTNRDQRLKMIL